MGNQSKTSLSLFEAVPYTCYEVGHTWNPSCFASFLRSLRFSFINGMKVHIPLYLINILIKSFKSKIDLKEEIKSFIHNLLQSSLFITTTGSLSLGGFCFLRHLIGKFYGWHSFFVALCVGYIGLSVERKSSKTSVALEYNEYGTKIAQGGNIKPQQFSKLDLLTTNSDVIISSGFETLYGMALFRNIVKPLPNGEVMLFCLASAGFISLYRTPEGLPGTTRNVLSFFLGDTEGPSTDRKRKGILAWITRIFGTNFYVKNLFQMLDASSVKHASCPHESSCPRYFLEGVSSSFLVGFSADLLLSLFRSRKVKTSNLTINFQLTKFFTCYVTLLRVSNCVLRWFRKKDSPTMHGAVSGVVAGLASFFYKSSTISLYVMVKLIEVLTESPVCTKFVPRIKYAEHHIFAFSLAIILHAAYLEPHTINPRFWKMFCDFSGGDFPHMFRKLLDVYGTSASSLYPNFIPNLKKEYVTSNAVKELMIAHGKWQ